MDLLAYALMALSLVATIAIVIAMPMLIPAFILFWFVVLQIGKRMTRKRDEHASR